MTLDTDFFRTQIIHFSVEIIQKQERNSSRPEVKRLVLQTAAWLQKCPVTMPGFGSIPGRQEMLSLMCSHESLGNLIDLPPFSYLWNGNNYTCLLSNIILDFKDEDYIPDFSQILLCSLNRHTIFKRAEIAADFMEIHGWMKWSWFTLQMWHMFSLVLSQNKPFPELSVVEQIFVISMGTICFIKICFMLTDFCSKAYNTKHTMVGNCIKC